MPLNLYAQVPAPIGQTR